MRQRAALLMLLILGGCASTESRQVADAATCQRWGSTPGSEDFVKCMILLGQANALEDERSAARLRTVGAALQGFSAGYNASRPQSIHCTSQMNGTYTYTNCD